MSGEPGYVSSVRGGGGLPLGSPSRPMCKEIYGVKGIKARGGNELQKHLMGERLTQRQMILAKCYDCMNGYLDGKLDCEIKECPLYPLMQYRERL